MKHRKDSSSSMSDVRELATRYDNEALATCMKQALNDRSNSCYSALNSTNVINVLARASFVKQLQTDGLSIAEAIRELGKRMRALANNT